MTETPRHNLLVLYYSWSNFTSTVFEYLEAFSKHSRYNIFYADASLKSALPYDLECFDGIILFYSIAVQMKETDLQSPPPLLQQLRELSIPKLCILQDEYDNVNQMKAALAYIRINGLVTCVPPSEIGKVYGSPELTGLTCIPALTGYVPDPVVRKACRPLARREYVLGYRGRPPRFYYGRLGQEKVRIGTEMRRICKERGIPADIETDENKRIYGDDWFTFLQNCRAVLGVESGSSIFDFEGTLQQSVKDYVDEHPEADFETVHDLLLREHEGLVKVNQVSPRVFEAIQNWTGLVLFEGEYSGVVRPWEHYIPLKKDFSNVDDVLRHVMDDAFLMDMMQRAWRDVIESGKYSYSTFIKRLDGWFAKRLPAQPKFRMLSGAVAVQDSRGTVRPLHTDTQESFWSELQSVRQGGQFAMSLVRERMNYGTPCSYIKKSISTPTQDDRPECRIEGETLGIEQKKRIQQISCTQMRIRRSLWN